MAKEIMDKAQEAIVAEIEQNYGSQDMIPPTEFEEAMKDKDAGRKYILSHVFCQMAGMEGKDDAMAAKCIHAKFLDMYAFFRVLVARIAGETISFIVTQEKASSFGLTTDALLEAAGKNRYEYRNLSDALTEPGTAAPVPAYHIMPEDRRPFGADAVMNREILREISDRTGGDLIIFPCSVHRIMAIPYDPEKDPAGYKALVCGINQNTVAPEDRLTDSVYLYRRDTGEVSILA